MQPSMPTPHPGLPSEEGKAELEKWSRDAENTPYYKAQHQIWQQAYASRFSYLTPSAKLSGKCRAAREEQLGVV